MAASSAADEQKSAATELRTQGECDLLLARTALPRHPRPARCISCASMRLSLCASQSKAMDVRRQTTRAVVCSAMHMVPVQQGAASPSARSVRSRSARRAMAACAMGCWPITAATDHRVRTESTRLRLLRSFLRRCRACLSLLSSLNGRSYMSSWTRSSPGLLLLCRQLRAAPGRGSPHLQRCLHTRGSRMIGSCKSRRSCMLAWQRNGLPSINRSRSALEPGLSCVEAANSTTPRRRSTAELKTPSVSHSEV